MHFWKRCLQSLLARAVFPVGRLVGSFPRPLVCALRRIIVPVLFRLFSRQRRMALRNLQNVLGLSPAAANRMAREVFSQLTMTLLEFLQLPRINQDNVDHCVDLSDLSRLDNLLAEGEQGLILVTAHFGNWELLGAALSLKGYPVNAVVERQEQDLVEKVLTRYRRAKGISLVETGIGIRRAFRSLAEGQIVIILGDRHGGRRGISADFLGWPVSTPTGAAVLSYATGAPVVPVFLVRESFGRHRLEVGKPLDRELDSLPKEQYVAVLTREINRALAAVIRRHPEQWLWVYNRWKGSFKKGRKGDA